MQTQWPSATQRLRHIVLLGHLLTNIHITGL